MGFSQSVPDSLGYKVNRLFQDIENTNGPGCALAIISKGEVIFNAAYGMANLEQLTPISSSTVFDIASLSKQFTGYAISTLIEEGKIAESDDIRNYLPFVPDFGKTITVEHLIHHTSGLRDWPLTLAIAGWRPADQISFEDIMRLVEHQKELDFEPGTKYSYSNTGYNLLAAIVEKVSGQAMPDWLQAHLFTDLNMASAQIPKQPMTGIKNGADSYFKSGNELLKVPDLATAYGSSSMFLSMDDLIRWSKHFNEQIGHKNPVYLRMLEPGRLSNGDTVYYGFGLGLSKPDEPRRIAHTGGWAGFRSMITHYPDEQLSILVLSNSANFNTRECSQNILDIMQNRVKQIEKIEPDLKNEIEIEVDDAIEAKYLGTYQLGPDWFITITTENGQLKSRSNGEIPYAMTAKSDSSYWVEAYSNAIYFVKDSTNGYQLQYKTFLGKRVPSFHPDAKQLNKYVGEYKSEELSIDYVLTVSNGKLYIYHLRLGEIELFPDTIEGQFSSELGIFQFVNNAKNKITGFKLSGSRVKNIYFKKQ